MNPTTSLIIFFPTFVVLNKFQVIMVECMLERVCYQSYNKEVIDYICYK